MHITINGASYEVTEDEQLFEIPDGEIELATDAPVLFWQAGTDPTVRRRDYRFDTEQRLHAGSPKRFVSAPGFKLAVSLRGDLPPLETKRPDLTPPPDPVPTEEELAERALARRMKKDRDLAETIDLILWASGGEAQPVPPPQLHPEGEDAGTDREPGVPPELMEFMFEGEGVEDFRARAFNLLFRFGITEGENFEGGGELLSAKEKEDLLPLVIANTKAGNWLKLAEAVRTVKPEGE